MGGVIFTPKFIYYSIIDHKFEGRKVIYSGVRRVLYSRNFYKICVLRKCMLLLIIGKINKLVPTFGKCVPTKKLRKFCVIFLSGGNVIFKCLPGHTCLPRYKSATKPHLHSFDYLYLRVPTVYQRFSNHGRRSKFVSRSLSRWANGLSTKKIKGEKIRNLRKSGQNAPHNGHNSNGATGKQIQNIKTKMSYNLRAFLLNCMSPP